MLNDSLAKVELGTTLLGMTMTTEETPSAPEPENYLIESRYGTLTFRADQMIEMQKPILGFQELKQFGMIPLPGFPDRNLVLLQSLEEAHVSFPCLALDKVNTMIGEDDIASVYKYYGIKPEDGVVLCILTVRHESKDNLEVTANLRAPVFVDTSRRQAWQVILNNQSYPIRHAV